MTKFERIGTGREKNVFVSSDKPESVHAEYKFELSAESSKSAYYLNKIAHLLMPGSVVQVTAAGTSENIGYVDSVRIPHDQIHAQIQKAKMGGGTPQENERARQAGIDRRKENGVIQIIQEAASYGLHFDRAGSNYIRKPDGSYTYVEASPAFMVLTRNNSENTPALHWFIDREDLAAAIEQKLSGDQLDQARNALSRIDELAKEALLNNKTSEETI